MMKDILLSTRFMTAFIPLKGSNNTRASITVHGANNMEMAGLYLIAICIMPGIVTEDTVAIISLNTTFLPS